MLALGILDVYKENEDSVYFQVNEVREVSTLAGIKDK